MDLDRPFPIFSDEYETVPMQSPNPIIKTPNFLNMSLLPTANTIPSNAAALNFHHLSLLPMTELEERPETVLDACQSDLQKDLVTALVTASALPERWY